MAPPVEWPGSKWQALTLYYCDSALYKAQKSLVAAKFVGVEVEAKKFDLKTDLGKSDFLSKNPVGKVPFLETKRGCVFTSMSCMRYIARLRADSSLCGQTFHDEGDVDTWLEFCVHEVEVPLATWVYPCMGLMPEHPGATEQAKADVRAALEKLEAALKDGPYLLGSYVTLADIALVCILREGFARVIDAAFRKPFPKVTAWFQQCCALSQFKAVLGEVSLCQTAAKAIPTKFEAPPRKEAPKKEAAPKQASPKAAPKKEPKKEEPAKKASPKATPAPAPAVGGGDVGAAITALGNEIRILKDKLKAQGLKGKEVDKNEEVAAKVAELKELKARQDAAGGAAAPAPKAAASPKAAAAPAPKAAGGGTREEVEGEIKALGDRIRAAKEKMQAEGKSGKEINASPQIAELIRELQVLKKKLEGITGDVSPRAAAMKASPKAPPKASPKAAPAAAPAGGDVEAQIKALGDEIRELKAKLKAEGLTGKKVDNHDQVKEKVAQLQELKKKATG